MMLKAIVKPKDSFKFQQELLNLGVKAEEENGKLYIDQEIDPYVALPLKKLLDEEESCYEFYTKVIFYKKRG